MKRRSKIICHPFVCCFFNRDLLDLWARRVAMVLRDCPDWKDPLDQREPRDKLVTCVTL